MKNVKRARQALAQDQAAWNSTMHRGENVKRVDSTQFQVKRVHYILSDESLACGLLWEMDNVGTETIEEVSCNACITAAHDLESSPPAEEKSMQPQVHLTTVFTLAPATMDKEGTQDVPCSWLYDNEPVRQVWVPKIQATAQMNAYLSPIPYIAFDEAGLTYYIKKGKVTKAQSNGIAFDPIKAVIELNTTTKKEDTIMPAKKKAIVTPQVKPLATMTPLGVTPAPSALDAILAQPIAHIMQQAPVGVPAELLPQAQTKKHLPLPEERSEETIVQALAPDAWLRERLTIMQGTIDNLHAEVSALKEAYAPEKLSSWMVQSLKAALAHEGLVITAPWTMTASSPMEESMPVPAPYDPFADCLASIAQAAALNQKPAKPKSTLRIYTQSTAAPQAARQGSGKTDPAIIKAIQQAWKQGGVTQQALADKYGMDSKKVWFFVNRAKQLV